MSLVGVDDVAGTKVLVSWQLLANWDDSQWPRKASLCPSFKTPLQRAVDAMAENQNQVNLSEMQNMNPLFGAC